MDVDLSLKRFNLALHFGIFVEQIFRLLRLILKLGGQLVVLENGKSCSRF